MRNKYTNYGFNREYCCNNLKNLEIDFDVHFLLFLHYSYRDDYRNRLMKFLSIVMGRWHRMVLEDV